MHKSSLLFLGVIPLTSLLSIAGTRAYYKGQWAKMLPEIDQTLQKAKDRYEAQIAEVKAQYKTAQENLKNVQLGAETAKSNLQRQLNERFERKLAEVQAKYEQEKAKAQEYAEKIANINRQLRQSAQRQQQKPAQ